MAEQGGLCVECWSALETPETQSSQDTVIAPTLYNDASRALVLSLKHGGKIALARLMAQMMATLLDDGIGDTIPLLVPVPLHRARLWQRGYNQAALLARELERLGKGRLCVDALERTKKTPSLGGLGREERRRVLTGAISIKAKRGPALQGCDVVLVDDVYTSGATSSACVEALEKGGARSVKVVCFARVDAQSLSPKSGA